MEHFNPIDKCYDCQVTIRSTSSKYKNESLLPVSLSHKQKKSSRGGEVKSFPALR